MLQAIAGLLGGRVRVIVSPGLLVEINHMPDAGRSLNRHDRASEGVPIIQICAPEAAAVRPASAHLRWISHPFVAGLVTERDMRQVIAQAAGRAGRRFGEAGRCRTGWRAAVLGETQDAVAGRVEAVAEQNGRDNGLAVSKSTGTHW